MQVTQWQTNFIVLEEKFIISGLGTNKVAQHLVLRNKQTDFLILVSFTIHLAQKWHQILKFFNVFMTIIVLNALFQGKISFEIFIILHIQPWQKELINLNVSKEKKFSHISELGVCRLYLQGD